MNDENHLEDSKIHKIRHSTAHLLAQAVKQLYPDVQMGIGPVIENGFYYDFLKKEPFTLEDLKQITKSMKELAKKNMAIKKTDLSKDEFKNFLGNESLKKELHDDLLAKKDTP